HALLRGAIRGARVLEVQPRLIECFLRLDPLIAQLHDAIVGNLRRLERRPGARDLDTPRLELRAHVVARGEKRRLLELDQLLTFGDRVALIEVEVLDLADHVCADVDLELRIDFARRRHRRFDLLTACCLGVDLLRFAAAAANAEEDDEAEDDEGRDDDRSPLPRNRHCTLRAAIACSAAPATWKNTTTAQSETMIAADFVREKRDIAAKPIVRSTRYQIEKRSKLERNVASTGCAFMLMKYPMFEAMGFFSMSSEIDFFASSSTVPSTPLIIIGIQAYAVIDRA